MNTRFDLPVLRKATRHLLFIALAFGILAGTAQAQRIKDIASIAGQRANQLVGYGLVVGLDGTGDQTTQSPFTLQSMYSMLKSLGVTVPPGVSTQTRNTAAVMVTADLPALAKPGQRIDLTISSLGNARSIRGGTLLMTPLRGADGQIYALAQGNVMVVGAGAAAQGSAATINHLSAGRIPAGAIVERAPPSQQVAGFIRLDLKDSDYSMMSRTAKAIVNRFGAGVVLPQDSRSLQVTVPADPIARMDFIAELENLSVTPAEERARVVLNSRTGSVVVNESVTLAPAAVAHGNLTVKIQTEPQVSQPGPFSQGETVATARADIDIQQGGEPGGLIRVPNGTTLVDVVRALNLLGAKPADLMAILQALKVSGSLRADLEII